MLALVLVACVAGATAPSQGASSNVTITMTVPSATNIDGTGCATGTGGVTAFGTVQPGTSATTTSDCSILFGSTNDTAALRLYQRDLGGDAMRVAPAQGTGLIGLWTLNGGLTNLADQSANANPGTLTIPAQHPTEVAGPPGFGTALQFDGVDDRVVIPMIAAYNLTSLTVDAWVKIPAGESAGYVATRGTGPCADPVTFCSWAIWIDYGGNLEIDIERSNTEIALATGTDVTTSTWMHIAFSIDASNVVRAYVNGTQAGAPLTLPGPIDLGNGPIVLGTDATNGPDSRLNGSVDELRVVAGASPPATIAARAQARVRDYANGTYDWDTAGTSLFGACLSSVTDGAATDGTTWVASAGCPASDGAWWNTVVPLGSTAGSTVARTSSSGDFDARAHLRFGVRLPAGHLPGSYEAPLVFEVIAPAV